METCIIKSPLGFTKIVGDEQGIASITILNNTEQGCNDSQTKSKIAVQTPTVLVQDT